MDEGINSMVETIQQLEKENAELKLRLCVSGNSPNWKDAYKECFEQFIPIDKWDEAQEFLTTYGIGLAKEIARKEK